MTPAEKLQNLLDAPAFKRWFSTANFSENGVSFPSQFMANWVHAYFPSQLFVAFGFEPEISVYKKASAPAIVKKDNIRAYYGAMQNRLENTITSLNIQAENLQASESRISDVDVSAEMTNFTREQIISQSAVAMLAQANSLPQMAMKLIGG